MDHFVFSFVFVAHPRALLHDTTYLSKCQYLFEKFFNFFEIFSKDEKRSFLREILRLPFAHKSSLGTTGKKIALRFGMTPSLHAKKRFSQKRQNRRSAARKPARQGNERAKSFSFNRGSNIASFRHILN